jgi:hypothetical protein
VAEDIGKPQDLVASKLGKVIMAVEELQSIIKRCQILDKHDFKEEDSGQFQLSGRRCTEEGHIDKLVEIIHNEKKKAVIKFLG